MKGLKSVIAIAILLLTSCGNKEKQETKHQQEDMAHYAEATSINTDDQSKFPIYDFEGLEPMLHRQDGKTYIINFWATWCRPCIEEMPYFERVNAEQKDNNVKVILVNLDMPSMWKTRMEPYVEKKQLKSEIVILDDPKQSEWISKIDENWGGGIPATLIYNKEKRMFYPHGFTYEELNKELGKFVN
ncbi:TlpA disulfide reductase family protein [Flagellimonas nanhaiensis]|uniref:TlpA family protein disulfide reductase n=1 Tax=Flagellimonas nanhaiensis TaxID=2292706 RepID=A0A371JM60_9FLAO|nr:TlpA disulfide reductase family protein [Allomuricauda nanhaiensis]RDY58157.1 TlpA family protein disulfide reductase [Allomuricauda nanhaiensis]